MNAGSKIIYLLQVLGHVTGCIMRLILYFIVVIFFQIASFALHKL